jgi:hypothetical protein
MKRIAALVLFILLFAGGFRPMFVRLLFSKASLHQPGPESGLDRAPLRAREDPTSPELRAFLDRVRAQTKRREKISVVFAPPHDGWSYTYWRANYALSGRFVLYPGDLSGDVIAYWPAGTIERRK